MKELIKEAKAAFDKKRRKNDLFLNFTFAGIREGNVDKWVLQCDLCLKEGKKRMYTHDRAHGTTTNLREHLSSHEEDKVKRGEEKL